MPGPQPFLETATLARAESGKERRRLVTRGDVHPLRTRRVGLAQDVCHDYPANAAALRVSRDHDPVESATALHLRLHHDKGGDDAAINQADAIVVCASIEKDLVVRAFVWREEVGTVAGGE